MLDLKINHLQLLAQIVSTGSLTEAAQNLGLSAAAASRMLKKLQTEMNDPLFIRVWRGLTPTDTTTMMLPVVRELLDQKSTWIGKPIKAQSNTPIQVTSSRLAKLKIIRTKRYGSTSAKPIWMK